MLETNKSPALQIAQIRKNFKKDTETDTLKKLDTIEDVVEAMDEAPTADENYTYGTPRVVPNPPNLRVPANPLFSQEYSEVITYSDLQYLNSFYKTQIGHYVSVECFVGINDLLVRDGFLIGVGMDYIVLQNPANQNITTVDAWSIKFMNIYYESAE